MDGNWAANLALACFAVILAAILVNMVIAKINHTYAEVVRKGTLFYYKELFDLRYLYKRDPRYGYLASLEHPLSIVLLPTLCVVKCLERRKKKRLQLERSQFLSDPEAVIRSRRGIKG